MEQPVQAVPVARMNRGAQQSRYHLWVSPEGIDERTIRAMPATRKKARRRKGKGGADPRHERIRREQEAIRRRLAVEASLVAHAESGYPAFNDPHGRRMPDGVHRRVRLIEALKDREHRRAMWARNVEHAAAAQERATELADRQALQAMHEEELEHYGTPESRWEEPEDELALVAELSPRDRAPALPTRRRRHPTTQRLWYDAPTDNDVFYDARQYGGRRAKRTRRGSRCVRRILRQAQSRR